MFSVHMVSLLENTQTVNIANSGDTDIAIRDSEGNVVSVLYSMNKIVGLYLDTQIFSNPRMTETTKNWFKSNFVNWLKKGGVGQDLVDDKLFGRKFYQPLAEIIEDFVHQNLPNVTYDSIVKHLPDYIRKNPDNFVVFSGGRLFRMNKFNEKLSILVDFLLANEICNIEPNDNLMPPTYVVPNITKLTPVEASARAARWHEWTSENAERVNRETLLLKLASLKKGSDFEVDATMDSGCVMVKLLSKSAAEIESQAMKHCVRSYGGDIEQGKVHVYSLRDQNGVPQATIEWDPKTKIAKQIKGGNNSTVRPQFQRDVAEWLVGKGVKSSPDLKHIGYSDIQKLYKDIQVQ